MPKHTNIEEIYDEAVDIEDKAERLGYDVKVVARYEKALSLYAAVLESEQGSHYDALYNSARLRLEIGGGYKHPPDAFVYLQEAYRLFISAAEVAGRFNPPNQIGRFDALYNAIQSAVSVGELHADLGADRDAADAFSHCVDLLRGLVAEQKSFVGADSGGYAAAAAMDVGGGASLSLSLPPYQIVQNIKILVDVLLKLQDVVDVDDGTSTNTDHTLAHAQMALNEALTLNNAVDEQFKETDTLLLLQAKIHLGELQMQMQSQSQPQPQFQSQAQTIVAEFRHVLELRSGRRDSGAVEAHCELAEVLVEVAKSGVSGVSSWELLCEAQSLFKAALEMEIALKSIGSIDPQSLANQIKILMAVAGASTLRALLVGSGNVNYTTLINNSQVFLKRAVEITQPVQVNHPNWQVEDAKYEAMVRIIHERIKYSGESIDSQGHLLGLLASHGVDLEVYKRRLD
ncbi:hypothetical protein E3P86_02579 [Wallemia ichthyophaga]|uniref:Uncharacterized protein n=1 Tax=Wallemia ichthyophaga TaxID=245174 RepID=A0A4T0J0F7_WALIC|nr:hypothetical protein E3P86_02579 [Wallemia ichthyophaga]